MNDIVERLRAGEACGEISSEYACAVKNAASGCQCAEAADEIERLNSDLSDAVTDLNTARQDNASCTAHIHNQADRIDKLEVAMREIDTICSNPGNWSPVVMERIIERVQEISRAALEERT
jgi:hypothetical protein